MEIIHDNVHSKSIMFHDLGSGLMVQSNQHVIIRGEEAIVLDPGGHKIYTKLFAGLTPVFPISQVKYIFFSHQDPDIIAAANGWLMVTDAKAFISEIWLRFLPHFGIDSYVENRISPIPDQGMKLSLGGEDLLLIPAHFLHSSGNFMIYDTFSKILYSGDLGASLGAPYQYVEDFNDHIQYIEGFHSRYLPSSKPVQMFLNTVKDLDIEMVAPQHGAIFRGKETVHSFFNWLSTLKCGYELMGEAYNLPG
ncbi:MBL fold metallo-hydrolase [Myxococcota bacterium]|nr:MBL fold metallo-hydrolase [Myxococcota bacterium]MBU1537589.1 MBL fold metallo-hydrolase [Myxococcota bacterium]